VRGGPVTALQSYDAERQFAADENILNSSRSTRFMSPEPGVERLFRDAVLNLASHADFARPMVNSGRLSRPCVYPLPDAAPDLPAGAKPGSVAPDAPLGNGWLTEAFRGGFVVLALGDAAVPNGMTVLRPDMTGVIRARYLGAAAGAVYLIRPDQVIAGRWLSVTDQDIAAARKGVA
jgi:3-(3-hydroxy-phenyl)propionate hydroxylase